MARGTVTCFSFKFSECSSVNFNSEKFISPVSHMFRNNTQEHVVSLLSVKL